MAIETVKQKIGKTTLTHEFTVCDCCGSLLIPGQGYFEIQDKLICAYCLKTIPMSVAQTMGWELKEFAGKE